MATVEEYIAQGFDVETSELLAQASAPDTGGSLPFPVLKFSYDNEDILIEKGVKKGNLISGWQVDKQALAVKEEGVDHGATAELVVVASVFQNSHYDIQTKSTDVVTDIFYSSFDSPKMIDKKSGKTIKALKDAGQDIKFNNIMLILMKEDKEWKPYIHYMHGVNYNNFYSQLDELGIKTVTLGHTFKTKTKKVATQFNPAWVLDIVKATPRTPNEVAASISDVSTAMKAFNTWVKATNAGEVAKPTNIPTEDAPKNAEDVEIDINEDDIPF